jgi:apolipoprotein N-acyltransferase
LLARPAQGIAGRYDKQRLVPFGEYVPLERLFYFLESVVSEAGDFRPGRAPTVLRGEAGAVGPLICYEAVFPALARASARQGASLLANLTNDAWYAGTAMPSQHLAHAVFRAVETRRFLLRCANTGISAIVAPSGAIAARSRLDEAAIVRGTVVPAGAPTPYMLLGDVFAAACAIVALLAAAHAGFTDPGATRLNPTHPAVPQARSHDHA